MKIPEVSKKFKKRGRVEFDCSPSYSSTFTNNSTMYRLSSSSSHSLRAAAKAAKPSLTRGAHKDILFSSAGRTAIAKGINILADAVTVTLGPKGESRLY